MKSFIVSLTAILTIFVIHVVFISHHLLVPLIWAIFFLYLYGRNYFRVAIHSYSIFLLTFFADYLNFEDINFKQEFIYSTLILSCTFSFLFIYQVLVSKWVNVARYFNYAVVVVLYGTFILYFIYAINFDFGIIENMLYVIPDIKESVIESIKLISPWWIVGILFLSISMSYFLNQQNKKVVSNIRQPILFFYIVLTLTIVVMNRYDIRLVYFIKGFMENNSQAYMDGSKYIKSSEIETQNSIEFEASKDNRGETYIVIIPESLNKKHMGLYGYMRDTTPRLSERSKIDGLLSFTNVYSSHLPSMHFPSLSLSETNQYNNINYYNSLSIMDILRKADIETYWLTTQSINRTRYNAMVDTANIADHHINLKDGIRNNTEEVLLDEIENILSQKRDNNRVVFVYLANRWSYASRYDKSKFTIYTKELDRGKFGAVALSNSNINHYDNSIYYNDHIVNSILKSLHRKKGVNGLVLIPEYGEDVMRNLGHLSKKFTFDMTQIPMITWFSNDYRKKYGETYHTFARNKDRIFSNDMLYDTLLGLFDIKTERYNSRYDLASTDYDLEPDNALVLYGHKNYTDKDNYIYWQKANIKFLVDNNISNRIIPHRVNSIGKLKDIWNDGFRSFEFDVSFGDNDTQSFYIGHDSDVMGLKMENFLLSINFQKIQKVWMDFKNLNQDNYTQVIERLHYLDKKYQIKKKFIVESSTTSPFFKEIRKAGWHTSYYMPTRRIINLLKQKNHKEMENLAIDIARQTKIQNLSAISFDHRLYPFIKNHLESKLSNEIVYHIWDAPNISCMDFKEQLLKNKLYLDNRVKTLLTEYISHFNL